MFKSIKKIKKDVEAISPVVATLLLVLVAVASVTAFYLWESGWQANTSDQLKNSGSTQFTLNVAGSTTVNEFMLQAAPSFMNATPNYKVVVDSVGSGAGMKAIEQGTTDIGMISDNMADVDSTVPTAFPNLVGTTIGYDAVVVFFGSNSLAAANHNIPASSLKLTTANVQAIFGPGAPTITTWLQLENALVANGAPAIVDANSAHALKVYTRSDASGTSDAFCDKYLAASHSYLATVPAGFNGANGNTGEISAVVGDVDGIGYTSYGMVSTSAGAAVAASYSCQIAKYGYAQPTTTFIAPSTASIKAAVAGDHINGFGGARPLMLVTNGAPSGAAKVFIDYCTDATNNLAFCKSTGFVSLYA